MRRRDSELITQRALPLLPAVVPPCNNRTERRTESKRVQSSAGARAVNTRARAIPLFPAGLEREGKLKKKKLLFLLSTVSFTS